MRGKLRLSIILLALLLCSSFSTAQSTTSLRGVITDATGALLPGAERGAAKSGKENRDQNRSPPRHKHLLLRCFSFAKFAKHNP